MATLSETLPTRLLGHGYLTQSILIPRYDSYETEDAVHSVPPMMYQLDR